MNPSNIGTNKTAEHDEMHLWLYSKENQKLVSDKIVDRLVKSSEKESIYDGILGDYIKKDWSKFTKLTDTSSKKGDKISRNRISRVEFELTNIEREKPLYSGYKGTFLAGICDAIIGFQGTYIIENEVRTLEPILDDNQEQVKERICWEPSETILETTYTKNESRYITGKIIVEFKPKLNSISSIIGQVKVYSKTIDTPHIVLVTYDKNTRFDQILYDEGIDIVRIQEVPEENEKYSPITVEL